MRAPKKLRQNETGGTDFSLWFSSNNSQTEVCATVLMDTAPSEPIVVLMTAADGAEAARIAELLVNKKLAACVQLLPEIESVYRWNGEVQRDKEVLMLAKTTAAQFVDLERVVREIHSYDTPEIIAVPMAHVSEPYRVWLVDNV